MDSELEIGLSEEERETFIKGDCASCYQQMKQDETFASLVQKNLNREKLTDAEWEYILFRLYLVISRAFIEEESVGFIDSILAFLSKIGMKISRKDKPLYNECYKMAEYVSSFRKEKEINEDVKAGFDSILDSRDPTDLDILLAQYEESDIFRKNQAAFEDAYKESSSGEISFHERMYMNAFQRAYDREKELVKRRKNCTNSSNL